MYFSCLRSTITSFRVQSHVVQAIRRKPMPGYEIFDLREYIQKLQEMQDLDYEQALEIPLDISIYFQL